MDRNISLKVNNREIPLNPFVKNVFANVIKGLVNSLDRIPETRNKIEIAIEEEEKKEKK